MQTVAFFTFGCKLNYAESSTLERSFAGKGYKIVDARSKADLYVIHSCIVTAQAERKCMNAVKSIRKNRPGAKIAMIGCMPEQNRKRVEDSGLVDIVLGNTGKFSLPEILGNSLQTSESKAGTFVPSWSTGKRTRTFFKIQDGCDYHCAYCTIPHARGSSRSPDAASALEMIKKAIPGECPELVLTGINIGDFGRTHGQRLYDLLSRLADLDNISRIRLSSIEPDLLHSDVISLFAKNKRFMPHFHMPLQSGSASILKAMRRRYTPGFFRDRVEEILALMPHACIATDLIVGFPGETIPLFDESYSFAESLGISYIHIFTYSERTDTAAAEMDTTVPRPERARRSRIMHSLSERKKEEFYRKNLGREEEVLFETEIRKGKVSGFTRNYIRVGAPAVPGVQSTLRKVRIGPADDDGNCICTLIS